jgi:hypothetical protein
MSPYERGRKGNAFREGARRLPHQGNADMGQRGSGHLAVTGSANWATGMSHHKDQPAKQTIHRGVYVCQHLSIAVGGKACRAMPRSEPSRGNPAARECVQLRLVGSAGGRPAGAKVRRPVVWIAGWREIKILKPIDKVSLGETTSCRAVTTVNVNVASKSVDPRAEPASVGRRQHGVPKSDRCGISHLGGVKATAR